MKNTQIYDRVKNPESDCYWGKLGANIALRIWFDIWNNVKYHIEYQIARNNCIYCGNLTSQIDRNLTDSIRNRVWTCVQLRIIQQLLRTPVRDIHEWIHITRTMQKRLSYMLDQITALNETYKQTADL